MERPKTDKTNWNLTGMRTGIMITIKKIRIFYIFIAIYVKELD